MFLMEWLEQKSGAAIVMPIQGMYLMMGQKIRQESDIV